MPKGWRKMGRPKLTCTQDVTQALKEQGLKDGMWEYRDGWRLAINC